MKRLDKLVLTELISPWIFGVAIFTVIVMAGTYLFTLTNYIVSGAGMGLIVRYSFLLMPGIVVKTFSMAVLLATLLAFGRLSGDSEIVAIRAAGASLPRIILPVGLFGLAVAVLAFVTNEKIVSPASSSAMSLRDEIAKQIHSSSQQYSAIIPGDNGKPKAQMMAAGFDLGTKTLSDVVIEAYDSNGVAKAVLRAPKMQFTDLQHWTISPGTIEFHVDQTGWAHLGLTYPSDMPEPPKPGDLLLLQVRDLDALSMSQIRSAIEKEKKNPGFDRGQLANLEYGYYNKIALPLATIVFGLLGAPLGIRGHRTGTGAGLALSVIIIFSYMMLANLMNIYAMGQVIPAYAASFTPVAIGLIVAVALIYRKNH